MHEFHDEVNVIREIFMEIVWGFIAYFRQKKDDIEFYCFIGVDLKSKG